MKAILLSLVLISSQTFASSNTIKFNNLIDSGIDNRAQLRKKVSQLINNATKEMHSKQEKRRLKTKAYKASSLDEGKIIRSQVEF